MTVMDELFESLLKAAMKDDDCKDTVLEAIRKPADQVLLRRTQRGNTFLHIAFICGNNDLWTKVLKPKLHLPGVLSLLSATNDDGETPLLTAVKSGAGDHLSLASDLLEQYCARDELNKALSKQDRHGCNVLHHAIRNGYRDLALDLIKKKPALTCCANCDDESPMFLAVLRPKFEDVYNILLDTQCALDCGRKRSNALHAAVKYDRIDFVKKLFQIQGHTERAKRLVREEDPKHDTPVRLAAHFNRAKILEEMLKFDRSLGYQKPTEGPPLLSIAAERGHVEFAWALLEHCPDADYSDGDNRTCLHVAVHHNRMQFVKFILDENSKLRKLVNMQDKDGNSALHVAVQKCNLEMVSALLGHRDIDISVINNDLCAAIWRLRDSGNYAKNINWNKISNLIWDKDDRAEIDICNLHEEIKNQINDASRNDAKSLIKTYTGNTSLVAILIATITFAAAFTLPGGYSSSAGSEGLPIMARKLAFQAFIIFDTLGMFSSLAVAFICVIARWMDFEFLLRYRFFTKYLMWFAYMATTLAFATGLYTVLAPRLHWLAIAICVLSVFLPMLTMVIGEWHLSSSIGWRSLLKRRYRKPFNTNLLGMV